MFTIVIILILFCAPVVQMATETLAVENKDLHYLDWLCLRFTQYLII